MNKEAKIIVDAILSEEESKREDLLKLFFKQGVAGCLLEFQRKTADGNALESQILEETKASTIEFFRKLPLEGTQRPIEFYEKLFNGCLQEIFTEASWNHEGEDTTSVSQTLTVDGRGHNEMKMSSGGLFVPGHY